MSEPQPLQVGDPVRMGRTTLELTAAAERQHRDAGARLAGAQSAPPPATRPARAGGPAPPPPAVAGAQPSPAARGRPARAAPSAAARHTRAAASARPCRPRPAAAARRRRPTPDALPLGTVFAGCRVEEVIGLGDMGVVYRADELALQRPVALKVIRPEHSEEARFRERFRRESMVAASIDHPNVIPILEAGDEDGVLFITMRLVEGTDLRALIAAEGRSTRSAPRASSARSGPRSTPPTRAASCTATSSRPTCCSREPTTSTSATSASPSARTRRGGLTRQGSIVARAEYVAPEQILEDRVDALTDVYALGCLLFEALTGEAPYAGSPEGPTHAGPRQRAAAVAARATPRPAAGVRRRGAARDGEGPEPSAIRRPATSGEAALVAAGGQRRATAESVVATGDAARPCGHAGPVSGTATGGRAGRGPPRPRRRRGERREMLRWGVALGVLAVLLVAHGALALERALQALTRRSPT